MIWIGTSGFQYPEWRGKFYPRAFPVDQMLAFYGQRFNTTEINYTFYRMPTKEVVKAWGEGSPSEFRFSLKVPRQITHVKRLREAGDSIKRFGELASALGKKEAVLLCQLPPFFKKDVGVLSEFIKELPRGHRAAFEFRHPSWFDEEVYDCLRKRNVALCVAESEQLQTPVVWTADFGYMRLRREDYTSADIRVWGKVIEKQSKKVKEIFVYFKHEKRGIGPKFAVQLLAALKDKGGSRSRISSVR